MTLRLRCAIYTRKSSEEGLDQQFNSLHAQREACEAYVLSQTGVGWSAIKTAFDDGGYSGGSMERPGLKALLADIQNGLVDIVVVYKVDRLTRSLADFAKMVDLFDAKGVSFVSVTQAFNTTSSMGRLTLNVLLSFAQFEREVTGERIRDKVAASKAKGLRMGGRPPLGYDIVDGRLAVNEAEAPRVRAIFERYLQLGSVQALAHEGVASKRWTTKSGQIVGGGNLSRGALHYLLTNPAYRGVTRHHDKRYQDTHPAIIPAELWEECRPILAGPTPASPRRSCAGRRRCWTAWSSTTKAILWSRCIPIGAPHGTAIIYRGRRSSGADSQAPFIGSPRACWSNSCSRAWYRSWLRLGVRKRRTSNASPRPLRG
jgi:site-specific DNA recombinase